MEEGFDEIQLKDAFLPNGNFVLFCYVDIELSCHHVSVRVVFRPLQ